MAIEATKIAAMAYAVIATVMLVVMLRRGKFNRRIGYLFLVISTVLGFLIFAPMLPYQFQLLLMGKIKQLGMPVAIPAVFLTMFVVLSFAFGRVFCGYVCPVGATQELLYLLPGRKLKVANKTITTAFRIGFLIAFVILAVVFSTGLLRYLGLKDFFDLNTGAVFFWVFLTIVVISAFVYRPFCRLACPYGAVLSLAAIKGRFKLRRNENCINCKKCGEACPTAEVGWTDLKQECYMCNRCKDVCPVSGMEFTRRAIREQERKKATVKAIEPVINSTVGKGR
ncbi:MAG: 4Fe-4S binding protein [Chloroflexi bacterium]|nr:4Fe-4S binding protein [Chloroflexota bacterium]